MKTVKVKDSVTLAHNIPTGPLLHFYQTLSKYVLGYQSYGLHKICPLGENYTMNKLRVVSLTCNTPTGPPLHPYQILSNYLKQYGSNGLHKVSASGEIITSGRQ